MMEISTPGKTVFILRWGTTSFAIILLNLLPSQLIFIGQNGRHFTDNIFRCIFVNEKFCTFITTSLKFVHKGPIDNNPALV